MKDISTEVPAAEVRELMEKCLKNAALVNYTRVSDHAKIEGTYARTHARPHALGAIASGAAYFSVRYCVFDSYELVAAPPASARHASCL